jgi:hypothetical protein
MAVVNLPALDAAIAYIREHPEEHDQRSWIGRTDCRTTACVAGTIAQQAGWVPVWDFGKLYQSTDGGEIGESTGYVARGSDEKPVCMVAREILGVHHLDADVLFLSARTLEDIVQVRDQWAAGKGACLCRDGTACSAHED